MTISAKYTVGYLIGWYNEVQETGCKIHGPPLIVKRLDYTGPCLRVRLLRTPSYNERFFSWKRALLIKSNVKKAYFSDSQQDLKIRTRNVWLKNRLKSTAWILHLFLFDWVPNSLTVKIRCSKNWEIDSFPTFPTLTSTSETSTLGSASDEQNDVCSSTSWSRTFYHYNQRFGDLIVKTGLVTCRIQCYRSGTVNSNTVNSKSHLIQSYCKYLATILSFHV